MINQNEETVMERHESGFTPALSFATKPLFLFLVVISFLSECTKTVVYAD